MATQLHPWGQMSKSPGAVDMTCAPYKRREGGKERQEEGQKEREGNSEKRGNVEEEWE